MFSISLAKSSLFILFIFQGEMDFPYENMGQYENEMLRRKLHLVREENTQLVSQNHKLLSQLESMGYQLHQANAKVRKAIPTYYNK